MRSILGLFGNLWRTAQLWRISPVEGVRTGSSLAGLLMFFVMIFAIMGVILVTLGFDLSDVDVWLDAQGGWLDLVGRVLFRGLVWGVFLCCVLSCLVMISAFFADPQSLRPFWGAALGGAFLAFIAWVCSASLFAPL